MWYHQFFKDQYVCAMIIWTKAASSSRRQVEDDHLDFARHLLMVPDNWESFNKIILFLFWMCLVFFITRSTAISLRLIFSRVCILPREKIDSFYEILVLSFYLEFYRVWYRPFFVFLAALEFKAFTPIRFYFLTLLQKHTQQQHHRFYIWSFSWCWQAGTVTAKFKTCFVTNTVTLAYKCWPIFFYGPTIVISFVV